MVWLDEHNFVHFFLLEYTRIADDIVTKKDISKFCVQDIIGFGTPK